METYQPRRGPNQKENLIHYASYFRRLMDQICNDGGEFNNLIDRRFRRDLAVAWQNLQESISDIDDRIRDGDASLEDHGLTGIQWDFKTNVVAQASERAQRWRIWPFKNWAVADLFKVGKTLFLSILEWLKMKVGPGVKESLDVLETILKKF